MVRFIKQHGRYGKGDVAGFTPAFEARLVAEGYAEDGSMPEDKTANNGGKPPEPKREAPGPTTNRQTTVPGPGTKSK